SLAGIVDQATADDPGHVMVRVTGPVHPEVELGFRPLDPDSHPFDVLAGFEAPDDWTVFGLRTTGRARHLDAPQAPPPRVGGPLPPHVARWMDDGFFARWTLGAFPPLMTTALEVRRLLGDELGGQLVEAMIAILER